MKLGKILAATAALGLVAAPVAGSAAAVDTRAATPVEGEQLAGFPIWLVLLGIAIPAALIFALDGKDDTLPTSP
ncbi:MAG: hypothetical protein RLZZ08_932 [Pseudomonadota bacterium]